MPKGIPAAKYEFNYADASFDAYILASSLEEANAIVANLVEDDLPIKAYLNVEDNTLFNPTTLQPSLDMPITTSLYGFLNVFTVLETENV